MRILVIDDDAVSRELMALLLAHEGYEVETADSGDAALLHLEDAMDSRPDVVMADVQMPGITGRKLAQRLRAVCGAEMVLLAMSGSAIEAATLREFDGFLRKPFTMGALAEAIRGGSARDAGEADRAVVALDEGVYAKLLASMPDTKLKELYTLCLKDAETRVATMRRAASEGNDDWYRREAHAIKGGCGMVGAMELQTLATSMEERGLGDTNHLVSLDEFVMASERLQRILIARINEKKAEGLSGEDVQ